MLPKVSLEYNENDKFLIIALILFFQSKTINVNFSHLTRHTMKAVVYDLKLPTLEVELEVYGYRPGNEPVGYNEGPFVSSAEELPLKSIGSTTIYCIHLLYVLCILCKINTFLLY